MPKQIQLDDILEARIVCDGLGQVTVNRWFYRCVSVTGNGTDDLTALSLIEDSIQDAMKDAIGAFAEYRGMALQHVFPAPRAIAQVETANANTGALAGDPLPPQTAGLVAWQTETASRRARGRKYFPFPTEAVCGVDGRPTQEYRTLLASLSALMTQARVVAGPGGAGVDEVTLQCGIWAPPAGTFYPVARSLVREAFATQRRRALTTSGDVTPF